MASCIGVIPGYLLVLAVAIGGVNVVYVSELFCTLISDFDYSAFNANIFDLMPARASTLMRYDSIRVQDNDLLIISICGTSSTIPAILSIEFAGFIKDTQFGWGGVFASSAIVLSIALVFFTLFASGKPIERTGGKAPDLS